MAPWSTGKRTATCTYTHPCQLSTGEDPQPTELVQLSTGKEHLHVCTHHDQLARNTHMYSTYRYTLTNWCSYQLPKKPKPIKYVTCYEKRDHSGYFIKIEFLAWIDSSMCAESNGAGFMKNIDHKPSYDHFYALG